MPLRAHYFLLTDSCIYCGTDEAPVCRATIIDGNLEGIAVMCEPCGRQERDVAIEQGYHEASDEKRLFYMHNKGEKN